MTIHLRGTTQQNPHFSRRYFWDCHMICISRFELELKPPACRQTIFHRFKMTGLFLNWMRIVDSLEYRQPLVFWVLHQRAHILNMYSLSAVKNRTNQTTWNEWFVSINARGPEFLRLSIFSHTKIFSENSGSMKQALQTLARKQKEYCLEKLWLFAPFLVKTTFKLRLDPFDP